MVAELDTFLDIHEKFTVVKHTPQLGIVPI
jgi:hypothetical protein